MNPRSGPETSAKGAAPRSIESFTRSFGAPEGTELRCSFCGGSRLARSDADQLIEQAARHLRAAG
jgi:hypothetical protein